MRLLRFLYCWDQLRYYARYSKHFCTLTLVLSHIRVLREHLRSLYSHDQGMLLLKIRVSFLNHVSNHENIARKYVIFVSFLTWLQSNFTSISGLKFSTKETFSHFSFQAKQSVIQFLDKLRRFSRAHQVFCVPRISGRTQLFDLCYIFDLQGFRLSKRIKSFLTSCSWRAVPRRYFDYLTSGIK